MDITKILGGYDKIGTYKPRVVNGSGEAGSRAVGDNAKYAVRSMLLIMENLKKNNYANLDRSGKKKKTALKQICDAFKLRNCKTEKDVNFEIDKLLSLNKEQLTAAYVKRYQLYWVFNTMSAQPAFMQLKESFENIIRYVADQVKLSTLFDEYEKKWNDLNKRDKLDSSSPILYFWLDKKEGIINDLIDAADVNILGKPNDKIGKILEELKETDWQYSGFCLYEAIDRLKKLSEFPLAPMIKIIKLLPSGSSDIMDSFNFCTIKDKIMPKEPAFEESDLNFSDGDLDISDDDLKKKIEVLACRIDNISDNLNDWEEYYIAYTKAYCSQL